VIGVTQRGIGGVGIIFDVERSTLGNDYACSRVAPTIAVAADSLCPNETVNRERDSVCPNKVARERRAKTGKPREKYASGLYDLFLAYASDLQQHGETLTRWADTRTGAVRDDRRRASNHWMHAANS
jgi:hypothetical protein